MNTLLTVNLLIVGGGRSGRRFAESYMFNSNINITIAGFSYKSESLKLAEKFHFDYVEFKNIIDFTIYDVIALSVPYELKKKCIETINKSNYRGRYILEKPFAIDCEDYQFMMNMVKDNIFCVPFSRRYEKKYDISIEENTSIVWPLNLYKEVDVFYDLLPHCIDWIVRALNKDIISIDVISNLNNDYIFKLNGITFEVKFVYNETENVTVNGIEYPWIDIYKINNIMLSKLLEQEEKNLKLEKELYYISTIMEALQ